MVVLVSPALPPADAFSFLLRDCSEEEGEEWRILEQCLLCYQASALESWKGSTWERVPEKTNFRSRLIWEKACVHGAASGTLAGAAAGVALPLMDPTWSLPGPTEAAQPPQQISLSRCNGVSSWEV